MDGNYLQGRTSVVTDTSEPLRVKFVAKGHQNSNYPVFRRQLPRAASRWGNCEFIFDNDCDQYDWFVAYDDLPPGSSERFSSRVETLACPSQRTLFVTMEPTSIKVYGSDFLRQFGSVITYQRPWALNHPHVLYQQPSLRWFYGIGESHIRDWDDLVQHAPVEKTGVFSSICSTKNCGKKTLHARRVAFTEAIAAAVPEIELFGRGRRPIDDKAEAIAPYKYHLVIENEIGPHLWTEKLADVYLGASLPLHIGCTNLGDYFPEESFVSLDISDVEGSVRKIEQVIREDQYLERLPAILEARRRILYDYNLFSVLAGYIERQQAVTQVGNVGDRIYSRHALRKHKPGSALRYHWERFRVQRKLRQETKRVA